MEPSDSGEQTAQAGADESSAITPNVVGALTHWSADLERLVMWASNARRCMTNAARVAGVIDGVLIAHGNHPHRSLASASAAIIVASVPAESLM